MKTRRYANSRQKACLPCVAAKAKCDRKPGRCGRCSLRNTDCKYNYDDTLNDGQGAGSHFSSLVDSQMGLSSGLHTALKSARSTPPGTILNTHLHLLQSESPQSTRGNSPNITNQTSLGSHQSLPSHSPDRTKKQSYDRDLPDFADAESWSTAETICSINSEDISNRWLNSYVPLPGQTPKSYPASITAYIYKILKSYAALTVRGRGVPPFVHFSQYTEASTKGPLSTCMTLVRMCENPLPGSETVASDIIQREMNLLYENHSSFDDTRLLEAYQAYLIFSLVLYFKLDQSSSPFLRQAMTNLQTLACSASRRGIVCIAEQQHSFPRWEAWIITEAKRRTIYTMYLLDSVLSAQDGLPTMLGTELLGLPAPTNRFLWRAVTRQNFESAYTVHLNDWAESLRIDELWPVPNNLSDAEVEKRRQRVDQWLEGIDEFGTMMYAVTSCTHGV